MPVIRFAPPRWTPSVALVVLIISSPAAHAAVVQYSETTIPAGEVGQITVSLRNEGAEIAGVQNDIGLPPFIRVVDDGGRGGCLVNPAIGKELHYNLLWRTTGSEHLRAIVISLQDVAPIPDAVLYTCDVHVAPDTQPGRYVVAATNVHASDPSGRAIEPHAISGAVYVVPAGMRPRRPAATPMVEDPSRPHPTALFTIGRPRPATPAAPEPPLHGTPTPTATPDAGEPAASGASDAAVAGSRDAGGGCQIGPHSVHDPIGVLLLALIGVAGLARRASAKSVQCVVESGSGRVR